MLKFISRAAILSISLMGLVKAESCFKLSGISIGWNQCSTDSSRVIIESKHFKVLDTVIVGQAQIPIEKVIPRKELELSGFVVCENAEITLEEKKITLPISEPSVDLGSNVIVYVDSVYLGNNSRKLMSALNSELEFKKFRERERRKRFRK